GAWPGGGRGGGGGGGGVAAVVSRGWRSGGGVHRTLGAGAVPATPRTPGGLDRHALRANSASAPSARAPPWCAGEPSVAVTMWSGWDTLLIPLLHTGTMRHVVRCT